MPPLKVLHVIPSVSPRDGGPTRAMGIMERALSEAGVEVTTLTTDHDLGPRGAPCALAAEYPARRIYARKWLTPYKVAPSLVTHLLQAVARHDVVHIHALFSFSSTAAAWVARSQGVPYVVRPLGTLSEHGLRARRRRIKWLSLRLIEGAILRRAAAVQFTSRAELDEARLLGLPMRSIVIPLGIDSDDAASTPPIAHESLVGRRVILFLSRLDPKKNVEALIDAVASSAMLRDSCAVLIAGEGEPRYVASLAARAAAAGLSDRTVWLGHVDGARKWATLAAADVFVLPSFSENFGLAAAEALLAGVPCVLAEGVAIARDVEEAGAGFTVPPNAQAIAEVLERVVGPDTSIADRMGSCAKRLAERFSARTMARQMVQLYEDISRRSSGCGIQPTQ